MEKKKKHVLTIEERQAIASSNKTTTDICVDFKITRQTVFDCRKKYPALVPDEVNDKLNELRELKKRKKIARLAKPGEYPPVEEGTVIIKLNVRKRTS